MVDKVVFSKTQRLIADDRLERVRHKADEELSFCLPASIYQVAARINPSGLPRPETFIRECSRLEMGDKIGSVSPESVVEALVVVARPLGVRVARILSGQAFAEQLVDSGVKKPNRAQGNKGRSCGHAEFMDDTQRTKIRESELNGEGWRNVAVIEFEMSDGAEVQTRHEVAGRIERTSGSCKVSWPHVRVLARKVDLS
jgi:hypothetical protein